MNVFRLNIELHRKTKIEFAHKNIEKVSLLINKLTCNIIVKYLKSRNYIKNKLYIKDSNIAVMIENDSLKKGMVNGYAIS